MAIIDSHCHVNSPQYDADQEEMLTRAKNAGVSMICVGTNLETSKQAIELANKWNNPPSPDGFGRAGMWATVGIHPNELNASVMNDIRGLEQLLSNPKVVALGEVGLDYYRTPDPEQQKVQKDFLKQFIELAVKHNKPLVLHARDSAKGSNGKVFKDLFEILNSYFLIHNSKLRGVVHSFTGTVEEAKKYLELGFYVGFNGIITFAPQYDDVVRSVPLDRILLETDAPYLTPEPYRGKRNEPYFVTLVVDKLAALKGVSRDEVITQTTKNCRELFKLD